MNDSTRWAAAVHEGAHCAAAWLCEHRIDSVRVHADGSGLASIDGTGDVSDSGMLRNMFVSLAAGETVRAFGLGAGGDRQDLNQARSIAELLDYGTEALDSMRRITRYLVDAPPFQRLVRAIAPALYERGELDGVAVEEMLRQAWELITLGVPEEVLIVEEPEIEREDDSYTRDELEQLIRKARLREIGLADYPNDWDEGAELLEVDRQLREWQKAHGLKVWQLTEAGDTPPKALASTPPDDLPEQVELTLREGEQSRDMTVSRKRVRRALDRGYKLTTIRSQDGKVRREVSRSRSATRALDGPGGQLIGEEQEEER